MVLEEGPQTTLGAFGPVSVPLGCFQPGPPGAALSRQSIGRGSEGAPHGAVQGVQTCGDKEEGWLGQGKERAERGDEE